MQDLIIIGAGGSSREIAGAVEDINRVSNRWNLVGFLDDDPAKHDAVVDGVRVLGPTSAAHDHAACQFITGIANSANPALRKHVVQRLGLPLERYATIVHPSASVSRHARVGVGTAILQNVVVTSDSLIGNHVIISQNASLAHDQDVADYVTIALGAVLCGFVRIGAAAYVGAGSVILPRVIVEENALVGAGAIVARRVPAGGTVAGNPARSLRPPAGQSDE